MLHARDLTRSWEQLVEMAAPARGILAVAESANLGPVQHLLNPPTNAGRGFRLSAPDRLKDLHNQIGSAAVVQLSNRHVGDRRIDMLRQRCRPLHGMTGIRPCRPLRVDESFSGLPEGNRRRGRGVIDRLYGSAICDLICRQLLDPVQKFSNGPLRGVLDWRTDTHAPRRSPGRLVLGDGPTRVAVKK